MTYWTLQYVDGGGTTREKSFAELAALEGGQVVSDGWQIRFETHKASTVTLRLPGVPAHIAPQIPFESRVTIWSGRTLSAGVYSGGTKQFQGMRIDRQGKSDRRPSSSYTFADEFYFLEHLPFYQTWTRVTNFTTGATATYPYTNIILFQPNPGQTYSPAAVNGHIHTGQMIVDILNWAISLGANLQIGTIDPATYCAWYPVQNVKCSEALRMCLRLHPDCFTEIDYTTTPPTFHVRARGSLAAVTLPYAYTDSDGRRHVATDIQPRPELIPKRVAIFYRILASGGVIATPVDIYPWSNLSVTGPVATGQFVGGASAPYTAGGTPIVGTAMENINTSTTATIKVGAACGLRALDFAVDLQGPRSSQSTGAITSAAFDPTNLAWWQKKVPSLKSVAQGGQIPNSGDGELTLLDSTINTGGHPKGIQVKDEAGNPINLTTYAYELDPKSSVLTWMNLSVVEATVTAFFSYKRTTTIGGADLTEFATEHKHHCRVKLVNSPTATFSFSQYLSTGEAVPPDLAQQVYTALAQLQYNLSHSIVEKPFNGWLKPGKHAVNLDGGAVDWETMNATVQTTTYRMHLDGGGDTFDNFDVRCGPVEHLDAGELLRLFNLFQNRDLSKMDTNERLSGNPNAGLNVTMPSDAAQENSVPAGALFAKQNFYSPDATNTGVSNVVTPDATTGQIQVTQKDSSAGTTLTSSLVMAEFTGSGDPGPSTLS